MEGGADSSKASMKGTTERQAESVRRSFYAHLSLHGQADIELRRVDFVLARMQKDERTDLSRVGAALGCDALLIGKVTKFG